MQEVAICTTAQEIGEDFKLKQKSSLSFITVINFSHQCERNLLINGSI